MTRTISFYDTSSSIPQIPAPPTPAPVGISIGANTFLDKHFQSFKDVNVVSGLLQKIDSPSFEGGSGYYFSPGVVGDEISFSVRLRTGRYQLKVTGTRFNAYGLQDVFVDGIRQGSLDWYANTAASEFIFNAKLTLTFVVPYDKSVTINFRTVGKNPASSGFGINISFCEIAPFF